MLRNLKIFHNPVWMSIDALFKLATITLGNFYLARYFGVNVYGEISYLTMIINFFVIISKFSIDVVFIKFYKNNDADADAVMANSFFLLILSSLFSIISLFIFIIFFETTHDLTNYLFILSFVIIISPFNLFEFNLIANQKISFFVFCKILIYLLSLGLKLFFIKNAAPFSTFIFLILIDYVLFFLLQLYIKKKYLLLLNIKRNINYNYLVKIFRSAIMIMSSTLCILIFTKADQFMIAKMLGYYELGVYSAAVKIFDIWLAFSFMISYSLMPYLSKITNIILIASNQKISRIYFTLITFSILITFFVYFFNRQIILYSFGINFLSSAEILLILFLSAPFAIIGSMNQRLLLINNKESVIILRVFLGSIFNILFNYWFIPIFGIIAAAYSTVGTLIFVNFIMNFIDSRCFFLNRIILGVFNFQLIFGLKNDKA